MEEKICEWKCNNPIYSLLSTWITTCTEPFGPKKSSTFMHGLKSAILALLQKSANRLDWPCPVSTALHFARRTFFYFLPQCSLIFKYETIVRRRAVVWSFRSRSKQCVYITQHADFIFCSRSHI